MRRRTFLQSIPITVAGFTGKTTHATAQEPTWAASALVVFFSRTGNTRVIASQIRRAKQADLFEIVPGAPYPEDYDATVAQARSETSSAYLPPLARSVANISSYDTIYLGFPVWGTTAPPVIRSFLQAHDLAGKQILPFVTHGGYGIGSSMDVVSSLAPDARFEAPFSMECDQERRTLREVTGWLADKTITD
jgi:flavodoxin